MAIRLPCMHVWPTREILICGIVHTLHMIANKQNTYLDPFGQQGHVWFLATICQEAKIWQPYSLLGMCLVFATIWLITLHCMYIWSICHRLNFFLQSFAKVWL
jgi:hypothetical protein